MRLLLPSREADRIGECIADPRYDVSRCLLGEWWMFQARRLVDQAMTGVVAAAASVLAACGPYPPIVDSRSDIGSLPIDTHSIRARGLRDDDIPALGRLTNLAILDFTSGWARNDITTGFKPFRAAITDRGLKALSELALPNLDSLSLDRCDRITDAGLAYVARMSHLHCLMLNKTAISDAGLTSIAGMTQLTFLDLEDCPAVTDDGLPALFGMSHLYQLSLGGTGVTRSGLAKIQAALPDTLFSY